MYRIVSELSTRAGQPMPQLYISPTEAPNAFATGRNPENAAVCCTEGILGLLDERELRGVLGHELDARLQPRHPHRVGGRGGRRRDLDDRPVPVVRHDLRRRWQRRGARNPMAGSCCSPSSRRSPRWSCSSAISRTREYDADEDGATLTGDPLALASALRKLEIGVARPRWPRPRRSSTPAT